jgi:hypothetical protein
MDKHCMVAVVGPQWFALEAEIWDAQEHSRPGAECITPALGLR